MPLKKNAAARLGSDNRDVFQLFDPALLEIKRPRKSLTTLPYLPLTIFVGIAVDQGAPHEVADEHIELFGEVDKDDMSYLWITGKSPLGSKREVP